MSRLTNWLVRLGLTLSYVSCFHLIDVQFEADSNVLSGLAKYLPAAGLVIGFCLWLCTLVLTFLLAPPLVAGAIMTILWFVFTSGLHLDGLMDSADGIFSHQSKERMLEIMSDPRVGNFAVIVGVLLLIVKFATITSIYIHALYVVLLVIPVWARFSEVYAIGRFDYLKQQGKGKVWHDSTVFPADWIKSGIAPMAVTLLACVCAKEHAVSLIVVSLSTVLSGIAASHWLTGKLGGQTGDTYGATVELSEAAGLIAASLLMN
jgi:cobalamin 5'-phosphate synthase/cobalamin synthase